MHAFTRTHTDCRALVDDVPKPDQTEMIFAQIVRESTNGGRLIAIKNSRWALKAISGTIIAHPETRKH